MEKWIRYWLVSLLALSGIGGAKACWVDWYVPSGYYMYRVYESTPQDEERGADRYPTMMENCREWQRLTSKDIPVEDIIEVVYKMPLEEFEMIYDNRQLPCENGFVEWITKRDTEILDFLLLAKTNEYIRLKRNSRWYYPSMKIGARMSLEEVADRALTMRSTRLRDRYLLQGVRALFTLGRYQECIDLWENEVSKLPDANLMRQLIYPYIAGAKCYVGDVNEALEYFSQIGDINSMLYCLGRAGESMDAIDALALVCEHTPNSPYIRKALQECVRKLEPEGSFYNSHYESGLEENEDLVKLYQLCLDMASDKRSSDPALWCYTIAFLSDLRGNIRGASQWLKKAESLVGDIYLEESIRVMRIYLDSKMSPYDESYEKRLYGQLKWLDEKIVHHITDEVREVTARGYKLGFCESYYYWNDMMRRIVLAEVCPRMLKKGKTTRALQLANMASNRLLGIVDRQEMTFYEEVNGEYQYSSEYVTMEEYRYSAKDYNRMDYRSHFFELIDSVGLDAAIAYVECVEKPETDFDRFLNERGYINRDYLYDIIGTQCLRNMRYEEAVRYLSVVSKRYHNHLNVYMNYDPFVADHSRLLVAASYHNDDFKYAFAREMHSLEESIKTMEDPNRKAQLMVRYAIGMKNSFERCWALTQYYVGTNYYASACEKRDWENDHYTEAAMKCSRQIINDACGIVTDDEVGAEIQYTLCNFRTVAMQYPNTKMGQLVKGECDNLYDHHAEKRQRRLCYSSYSY